MDYENELLKRDKNKRKSSKSKDKDNIQLPEKGDLLFHPRKSKRRSFQPLFTKKELQEIKEPNRFSLAPPGVESVFKKAKEIFPSKYGIEMPYKSSIRQSNYSVKSSRSYDRSSRRKTNTGLKQKRGMFSQEHSSIKEFDYYSQPSSHFKLKKYGRKNYYMYKGHIRNDNPFVGVSQYHKNTKERRSLIAKTVKKEGNEYNKIISLEENIIKKRELNEKELKQLIITITKFLYEDEEKNLDNKILYEYKISKVSNIIKFMNDKNQKIILEELNKNAKDEYSSELFEILKAKIDEYKEKLIKVYKNEESMGKRRHSLKPYSPNKKMFRKIFKQDK